MRTIRNLFAAVLIGSAAVAFQVDANAQSRSVNRSSSSNTQKQTSVKPSSQTRQTVTRPSAKTSRPSVQTGRQQASPNRQTATRPSSPQVGKPSNRPSDTKPTATRPTVTRPSAQSGKPSVQAKPSTGAHNNRPQSGSTVTRKPSPTVSRPSAGQSKPEVRPGQRPGPGSAFKPGNAKPPVGHHHGHKPDKPRVHPSHRDFIAYDRPAHFWTPHYHYFGHRVRLLPARATLHVHFGVSYYCYDNIWYRPFGGHYIICRPPFGTVLASNLIADMAWAAVRFSYYNTVYNQYRQINENNRYIAEQNEMIARNNAMISAQNAAAAMNQQQATSAYNLANELGLVQSYAAANSEYFYQDGVFYTKTLSGEYTVIVPPAGAVVDSLPEDYETITLNGNDYYKVDNTVYKVILNDGRPYFEVLGQL